MMREADEKGIDNVSQVKWAIRDVEEGESSDEEEFGFWSSHWKSASFLENSRLGTPHRHVET